MRPVEHFAIRLIASLYVLAWLAAIGASEFEKGETERLNGIGDA